MFCYTCGAALKPRQKLISYENGGEQISVVYTHCNYQWIIDDRGIITACGPANEKKGENDENQKTN